MRKLCIDKIIMPYNKNHQNIQEIYNTPENKALNLKPATYMYKYMLQYYTAAKNI